MIQIVHLEAPFLVKVIPPLGMTLLAVWKKVVVCTIVSAELIGTGNTVLWTIYITQNKSQYLVTFSKTPTVYHIEIQVFFFSPS